MTANYRNTLKLIMRIVSFHKYLPCYQEPCAFVLKNAIKIQYTEQFIQTVPVGSCTNVKNNDAYIAIGFSNNIIQVPVRRLE